jgi:carbon starvation protein
MTPGDYFAINTTPEVFSKLGLHTVNLNVISGEVGEKLAGRTGGAVSLAVGMAQIFKGLPGMQTLMGYWYHFAIMFEALFILTTVDTGTRVARYVMQEVLGKAYKPFANPAWLPGNLVSTGLIVAAWGYMIYTGSISTIWPLFGTGNQLLATIALAVATTFLVNMGKARYAWVTAIPMVFVGGTTLTAAVFSIRDIFWPMAMKPGTQFTGYLDTVLMTIFIIGVLLVVFEAGKRCWSTLHGKPIPPEAFGSPVGHKDEAPVPAGVPVGCC